jgi:hypothetical protein
MFYLVRDKRRQIAFMPRRHFQDAIQVFNILKFRGELADFDVVAIHDVSHDRAAAILRESAFFLAFRRLKGSGCHPRKQWLAAA